jgi:hypothetical protein
MVYNGYYKVMSNIPKMGQLPTPVKPPFFHDSLRFAAVLQAHGIPHLCETRHRGTHRLGDFAMNRGDFNGKNHGILMGINGNLMDFHWD